MVEFDKLVLTRLQNKAQNMNYCIENLNKFCLNQLFHTSPDFKHNEINPFRQKVIDFI